MGDNALKTSPIIIEDTVVATYKDGLALIDGASGRLENTYETGEINGSSPCYYDGRIFWGDKAGYLRCLAPVGWGDSVEEDEPVERNRMNDVVFSVIAIFVLGSAAGFIVRKQKKA